MSDAVPRRWEVLDLGRVGIVGAGQIGTSLGIALRESGAPQEVAVFDRDPSVARQSVRLGGGDRVAANLEEVLSSDVVILAVPVPAIVAFIEEHGPGLRDGSLLLDVGSTKFAVVEAMRRYILPGVHAVGGHPMAGTQVPGPAGARRGLFRDRLFALSPARHDPEALVRARRLVELIDGRPFIIDADEHDRILARTSHLPHLLAFALSGITGGYDQKLKGTGLESATRLSRSDPEMVGGMISTNAAEVRTALEELRQELDAMEALLDSSELSSHLRKRAAAGVPPGHQRL